ETDMPDGNAPARLREAAVRAACSDHVLQASLSEWNRARLAPQTPDQDLQEGLRRDEMMRRLEQDFIELTRTAQSARALTAPCEPAAFVAWFEALKQNGPGQGDALFPWLAEKATLAEMRWFVEQEAAGEAGFDDLVA